MKLTSNRGRFLSIEGTRLAVAGERIYVDGQPLDELLRDAYLEELEYHDAAIVQLGPARITIEAP